MPITFLAGHILECLLKAFLSKAGISEEDLRKQFGHDLSKLWQEAVTRGLPIASVLPQWAKHVSKLHGSPYYLRYNPQHWHSLRLPNGQMVLSELTALLETIRKNI